MENNNLKRTVFSGLMWKFMENGGRLCIQFIISIVLARLLLPEDYGVLALIIVFITIAEVFVTSGFSSALIQKKEVDDEEYSSVFYFSLFLAIVVYVALFVASPFIANFYNEKLIIPVLRVQSLTLLFSAFNSIQNTVLSRKMKFEKSFARNLGSMLSYGLVGITMAYMGFGIWALAFSQLASDLVGTIILWFTVNWRPKLLFSFKKLKVLFRFGSKMLCTMLIDTIYHNVYSIIIGKIFNKQILAYYNRGQIMPTLIVDNINSSILAVLFPALSISQNDKSRVRDLMRRSMVTSSFFIFPMMIGLAVLAEPITILLFTEKWAESIPYTQLACIAWAFVPVNNTNIQAIIAIGRSDVYLKLEIIKKILGVVVLLISMLFGIYAMMIGTAVVAMISTFINTWPNKKLLNYSFKDQWRDIMPSLLLSIVMGSVAMSVGFLNFGIVTMLTLQVIVGVAVYTLGAYLFKFECLTYILNTLIGYLRRDKDL